MTEVLRAEIDTRPIRNGEPEVSLTIYCDDVIMFSAVMLDNFTLDEQISIAKRIADAILDRPHQQ